MVSQQLQPYHFKAATGGVACPSSLGLCDEAMALSLAPTFVTFYFHIQNYSGGGGQDTLFPPSPDQQSRMGSRGNTVLAAGVLFHRLMLPSARPRHRGAATAQPPGRRLASVPLPGQDVKEAAQRVR